MTSNHHARYDLGDTRATMDVTKGGEAARWSKSLKTILSSACRLQLACMKQESLVIADQHAAVNPFPGLVHTARHTTRAGNSRSRCGSRREPAAGAGAHDRGEGGTGWLCRTGRRDA